MSTEIWKVYVRNKNYEISNLGRVRRARNLGKYKRGGLLKPQERSGYCRVALYDSKNIRVRLIHLMVAETFIGLCPIGMECNHKDGIKSNNYADNLEWTTPSDNQRHAYRMGLKCTRGERNGNSKLTLTDVIKMRKLAKEGHRREYLSAKFGVSRPHVSRIIHGTRWAQQ